MSSVSVKRGRSRENLIRDTISNVQRYHSRRLIPYIVAVLLNLAYPWAPLLKPHTISSSITPRTHAPHIPSNPQQQTNTKTPTHLSTIPCPTRYPSPSNLLYTPSLLLSASISLSASPSPSPSPSPFPSFPVARAMLPPALDFDFAVTIPFSLLDSSSAIR